jgi:hypothetical protein
MHLEPDAPSPPRKRGAPKGNRNAWKHVGRSAAAKAARAAARAGIVARLPHMSLLHPSLRFAATACEQLRAEAQTAPVPQRNANDPVASARGLPRMSDRLPGEALAGPGEGGGGLSRNKTNNSIGRPTEAEKGGPPSDSLRNKPNNSFPREAPRNRGAPKGNNNALKHGAWSGKRQEFRSELRTFLHRLDTICDLALAHAKARPGSAR